MRDSIQSFVERGCEPNSLSVACRVNGDELPHLTEPRTPFVQGLELRQGTRKFEAGAVCEEYRQGAIEHRDSRCDGGGKVQLPSLLGNLRQFRRDPDPGAAFFF